MFSTDSVYSHAEGECLNTTEKEPRHWQQADGSTHLVDNYEEMRGRSHTHTFRLGTDYHLAENHSLSVVYNGSYMTGHNTQHTTGTQTADSRTDQTSWLHNGRFDYQTPFGLKAGAEFTWYNAPDKQWLDSRMGGVWSLVRIQSPRLVKSIDNQMIVDAFCFLYSSYSYSG